MRIDKTQLPEVKVISYDLKRDNRGYSHPVFIRSALLENGIDFDYCEERIYYSAEAGTLYGIHFQNAPAAQAKLIYCISGRGIDYAVDLRRNSPNYRKWVSVEISEKNRKQLYIPKGFGHAFLSLAPDTRNVMRFDVPFDNRYLRRIAYNDPTIGIPYPVAHPILAPHDRCAPLLDDSDINL